MIKKHARKKLDPIEREEYFKYIHDKECNDFLRGKVMRDGVPGFNQLYEAIQKYHNIKHNYIASSKGCSKTYNKYVFEGINQETSISDPF